MKTTFVLPLLVVFITACGTSAPPVAFQPVQPDPELHDYLASVLGASNEPINLYQAIVAQGVPSRVAQAAFEKYDQFEPWVRNKTYISMIDFTQHSGNLRFYQVHRATGRVSAWAVAHGEGSDPDNDGFAQYFSNIPNSHMSSLGSYLIQEKYVGKYGESLRLDGLEETNDNARARAIVLHPSNYVKDTRPKQGRSWGCPAIPYKWIQTVISRSQDGSFLYAYGINRRNTLGDADILKQWELIPKSLWVDESEAAPVDGE